MTVQTMVRCALALLVVGVASGCSSSGRSFECRWNPSSCMYEGAYEPDEERYAEEEARRLNRASNRRF